MSSPPRVLILSAPAGAGHVRAAQALEKAFAARGDCAVEHIDAIAYVSKLFRKIYEEAHSAMVRRAPELMGFLYDRFDRPWRQRRRLALDRLNTGPMIRLLDDRARLDRMRQAAVKMAHPRAAAEIAEDALGMLK